MRARPKEEERVSAPRTLGALWVGGPARWGGRGAQPARVPSRTPSGNVARGAKVSFVADRYSRVIMSTVRNPRAAAWLALACLGCNASSAPANDGGPDATSDGPDAGGPDATSDGPDGGGPSDPSDGQANDGDTSDGDSGAGGCGPVPYDMCSLPLPLHNYYPATCVGGTWTCGDLPLACAYLGGACVPSGACADDQGLTAATGCSADEKCCPLPPGNGDCHADLRGACIPYLAPSCAQQGGVVAGATGCSANDECCYHCAHVIAGSCDGGPCYGFACDEVLADDDAGATADGGADAGD
jgi:hypothetical protein